jgi:hypothetical protein
VVGPDPLAAVPAGDRAVARAALHRLERAPTEILDHSLRMIMIGRALAGRPVDEGMLVAACAAHDLGLLPATVRRWPRLSFPHRSAALLAEIADDQRIGRDRAEVWCWAVAHHVALYGDPGESAEASLLRRAAWLDATGIGSRADRDLVRRLAMSRPAGATVRLLTRVGVASARDLLR